MTTGLVLVDSGRTTKSVAGQRVLAPRPIAAAALDLAHESGGLNWQFEAWQGLGRVHHSTGHPDIALTDHDHALALAIELDRPDDQARAHDGLAHAHRALHQPDLARTHWHRALDLLSTFGHDHADDEETTVAAIQAHLADLETGTEEAPAVPQ